MHVSSSYILVHKRFCFLFICFTQFAPVKMNKYIIGTSEGGNRGRNFPMCYIKKLYSILFYKK